MAKKRDGTVAATSDVFMGIVALLVEADVDHLQAKACQNVATWQKFHSMTE